MLPNPPSLKAHAIMRHEAHRPISLCLRSYLTRSCGKVVCSKKRKGDRWTNLTRLELLLPHEAIGKRHDHTLGEAIASSEQRSFNQVEVVGGYVSRGLCDDKIKLTAHRETLALWAVKR